MNQIIEYYKSKGGEIDLSKPIEGSFFPSNKAGIHLRPNPQGEYPYRPLVGLGTPQLRNETFHVITSREAQTSIKTAASQLITSPYSAEDIAVMGAILQIREDRVVLSGKSDLRIVPALQYDIRRSNSHAVQIQGFQSTKSISEYYGDFRVFSLGSSNVRKVVQLPNTGRIVITDTMSVQTVSELFMFLTSEKICMGSYNGITEKITEHRVRLLYTTLQEYADYRGESFTEEILEEALDFRVTAVFHQHSQQDNLSHSWEDEEFVL